MRIFAVVALILALAGTGTTRAQPAPDGWQGIVLVVATSEISVPRLTQALAAFAPAFGQQPDEILHTRFSLDRTSALVEANWYQKPVAIDLVAALAGIDALIVVTVFETQYDAKSYLQNNINNWEIARPQR
jgi:hypothetical protein